MTPNKVGDDAPDSELNQVELSELNQVEPTKSDAICGRPSESSPLVLAAKCGSTSPFSAKLKLGKVRDLQVDLEILRGISLRRTLRSGAGRLWRRSPVDLALERRAELWGESRPVESFDIFLSHTWQTSGLSKVMSLVLQNGWWAHCLFGALGSGLAVVLCYLELLPLSAGIEDVTHPWAQLFGLLGSLLGLLGSLYLPRCSPDIAFLDVVSIHQTDPALMERGIYGLGGFLRVSRELRVLWSPPYLSRLWCVFELAAYRTANPTGNITLAPLFVESFRRGGSCSA
ncbi:unnamed protein product [Effrenium voratum]|nr:unnamed protein product [Effrenium voratum]